MVVDVRGVGVGINVVVVVVAVAVDDNRTYIICTFNHKLQYFLSASNLTGTTKVCSKLQTK